MWDMITPALSVVGAGIGSYFNDQAADEATQGINQGATTEAKYIQQGQGKLGQIEQDNAPGQNYLRNVVAGSGDLTPAQQKALDDIRLNTTNQIRTSSLAGSGRSAAAVLNDQTNRFTLGALDQNRQLAYGAAGQMAQRGAQAGFGIAGDYNNIGKVYGDASSRSGLIRASADLATGKLFGGSGGSAISGIGNSIAKGNKSGLFGFGGDSGDGGVSYRGAAGPREDGTDGGYYG